MKTNKKIFLIIISVLLIIPCFAVFSFANDVKYDEQPVVLSPASHIETITLILDDSTSGIPSTSIEIDYTNLLSRNNSTRLDYAIEYDTKGYYYVDNISYRLYYRIVVNTNYIDGYTRGSKYCALTFNCSAIGRADPSEDPDTRFLYTLPIKQMNLTYNMHVIHEYSTEFARPYDGNIDATIGFVGSNDWTSVLTFNTVGFDYISYRYNNNDLGNNLAYYRINKDNNAFSKRVTSSDVNNPNYIPVGVKYNNPDVNMGTVKKYVDNLLQPHVNQDDKYLYSLCTYATQQITFSQTYTGDFTITDMFSPTTKSDMQFMNEIGQIYSDNFEIGTFLRSSVDNFLEFEILDGFSLADLLWTIVGIGAVFALFFLLLGR